MAAILKSRRKWSSQNFDWATQYHFIFFQFSHSSVALALCFRSLPCWNVNLLSRFRLMADSNRFSSSIILYFALSIVPSILTSLSVPADEKQPCNMMLAPPCLRVGMVLTRLGDVHFNRSVVVLKTFTMFNQKFPRHEELCDEFCCSNNKQRKAGPCLMRGKQTSSWVWADNLSVQLNREKTGSQLSNTKLLQEIL